jgi:hypothetical protein
VGPRDEGLAIHASNEDDDDDDNNNNKLGKYLSIYNVKFS